MIEASTLTITCPLPEALKLTEVNGECTQLFTCPVTKQIYQITFKRTE